MAAETALFMLSSSEACARVLATPESLSLAPVFRYACSFSLAPAGNGVISLRQNPFRSRL